MLDPTPRRRSAAENLGLTTLDPDDSDPAVVLKNRWRHGPGDRGADVVLQCRGRSAAPALALRMLRPQGTVIDMAFFYSDDGSALRLGAEFHHNGLTVRCAQIARVPRGHHPHMGSRAAHRRNHHAAQTPRIRRTESHDHRRDIPRRRL